MMTLDEGEKIFRQLKEILAKGGVPFVVHEHVPTRTIDEAERNLSYAVERIVKLVVFPHQWRRHRPGGAPWHQKGRLSR